MKSPLISIILPCYNEEENIDRVYSFIKETLSSYNIEVVFVDDGSADNTLIRLKNIAQKDSCVKFISFSRNFGHQNALKAGYEFATGDCVITMDSDMQHPPTLIPQMIQKWQEGHEIVYTIRIEDKKLPYLKRFASKLFYKFINSISDYKIENGAADFRLVDKKVVKEINKLNESFLFFRGIVSWLGFKQYKIEYIPNKRYAGESKYSLKKMVSFALSGVTSFSIKPLRISVFIGVIFALSSFAYMIYALFSYIFTNKTLSGWTSLLISVLLIGGIQLIMFGVFGEYLGKMFIENKRRSNYIIRETNYN